MGLIKALAGAIGGGLGDAWLEVIEAGDMGNDTVFTAGRTVRANDRRNSNKSGTEDTVSNGSIIHVGEKQCMLLVDGGKIIDYTAEPGYFEVQNSAMPSMLNGQLWDSVKETFSRFKYSGVTPYKQKVYFVNLQEIKGIKFGTRNAVNYWDDFYNADLSIRAHGSYSIVIRNPILFYADQIARNASHVDITDINAQYMDEFLEAFTAALNSLSMEGISIRYVRSKGPELSAHMRNILDEFWLQNRGIEIQAVGIGDMSYSEESEKLINMRNQGAMLSDATIREGYVQGSIARGLEAAGSNEGGAAQTFMGMGMGMGTSGMGTFSETNRMQMQQQEAAQRQAQAAQAPAGTDATAATDERIVQPDQTADPVVPAKKIDVWVCPECSTANSGKFCTNCGTKKPVEEKAKCKNCGFEPEGTTPKFCPECGTKFE